MPDKPTAPKKKAKTAAPKRAPKAAAPKAKTPKAETIYYVSVPELVVLISDTKPAGAADARQFASFDGARRAAVDGLVQAIEDAEARLLTLRRAAGYAEWRAAGK